MHKFDAPDKVYTLLGTDGITVSDLVSFRVKDLSKMLKHFQMLKQMNQSIYLTDEEKQQFEQIEQNKQNKQKNNVKHKEFNAIKVSFGIIVQRCKFIMLHDSFIFILYRLINKNSDK